MINLKTAKALRLTLPSAALHRRRSDRIETPFAAVHESGYWHIADIRGTATICPLLDKSGHGVPLLSDLNL